MEVSARKLRKAVESQHGGTATFITKLPVKQVLDGNAIWDGVVHIFDLEGHPKAARAYAWSSPIVGAERHRFYAVLRLGEIRSPLDAVRAARAADHGEGSLEARQHVKRLTRVKI
jgi:hypothetical protein